MDYKSQILFWTSIMRDHAIFQVNGLARISGSSKWTFMLHRIQKDVIIWAFNMPTSDEPIAKYNKSADKRSNRI
ncbi:hypothetical protein [Pseudobacteroides cellulosolvens]|uniref:Uncharacterized protein n=1 Tax=Pseudobacteroides cellulosolvens ATCC 35603 = DSM 2933 TaxID=398512 RepID=A0A0L6JQI8_9FIRM|nr:hypothetical protein [Pseudobacteroides cellulosolvens]KNY28054.1 hypothetical protein Bccel_3325 [Pseudobacteroides cellulosolvens ATCC 35603 = DSM 2933]